LIAQWFDGCLFNFGVPASWQATGNSEIQPAIQQSNHPTIEMPTIKQSNHQTIKEPNLVKKLNMRTFLIKKDHDGT
jgi:hypothetical protein